MHTMIAFPCYVGTLSGVEALRIGARFVWIYLNANERVVRVARSTFSEAELANPSHELAFRAWKVAGT